MENYKEIKQGSLEWHEIKYRKIGGTLSSGLFVNSDTLFLDLLGQHLEEFEPSEGFESDAMARGKEMEPFALEYISKFTGLDFQQTGWLQSDIPLLGISPDGLTECERYACEIKCLSRKEHTSIIYNNEIPKDKIAQLIHYFTVNPKLEKLYFIAYRPESIKPFIKEITRETVFDLGWKTKIEVEVIGAKGLPIKPKIEMVTDFKTVAQWSEIAKENAIELQNKLTETINKLNF